jgi:hypothetical protein
MSDTRYKLDEETNSWLLAVLNLASAVADLQHNDDSADEIYDLLDKTAERFGLYTETENNVVTLRNFRVINGGGPAVRDSESQTNEDI